MRSSFSHNSHPEEFHVFNVFCFVFSTTLVLFMRFLQPQFTSLGILFFGRFILFYFFTSLVLFCLETSLSSQLEKKITSPFNDKTFQKAPHFSAQPPHPIGTSVVEILQIKLFSTCTVQQYRYCLQGVAKQRKQVKNQKVCIGKISIAITIHWAAGDMEAGEGEWSVPSRV